MCGLVGVTGDLTDKAVGAMRILLHLDVLRGEHSTGIMFAPVDGQPWVTKHLGTPVDLFRAHPKLMEDLEKPEDFLALMGHNRFATKGAVNVDNAHPFEFPNVIGAHNGTIQDYALRKLPDYDKFEVDSQVIYNMIDQTTIEEAWPKIDGAAALSWWDKRTSTLHLCRNRERSLFQVVSEDGSLFFYASEEWMLWQALSRNGIRFKREAMKEVPVNKHLTIKVDEQGKVEVGQSDLTPFSYVVGTHQNKSNNSVQGSNSNGRLDNYGGKLVEIQEFVKTGTKDHEGYFIAEEVVTRSPLIVKIDSMNEKQIIDRFNDVVDKKAKGMPFFRVKTGSTYIWDRATAVHYLSLDHAPAHRVGKPTVVAGNTVLRDKGGRTFIADHWIEATNEPCVACHSTVTYSDYHLSTYLATSRTCLCPKCTKNEGTVDFYLELDKWG